MEQFQVFIMPSKSENFGHALLEALSAGKPVITTNTTPFQQLQEAKAGFTVDIHRLHEDLSIALARFAAMNETDLAEYSKHGAAFAAKFVDTGLIRRQYQTLFT
jgi:glycosyltransferase involved in cell wall biosynthesis